MLLREKKKKAPVCHHLCHLFERMEANDACNTVVDSALPLVFFTCFPREQSVAWRKESSMDVIPEASQLPHSHLGEGNK